MRPTPSVHDESSYLLQAEIFASGGWTAPSPPIPDFFEQPHVLVVPAVASKYPPGHAMLLTIGSLLHFPPLVPLLLGGLTAALLFALAVRVSNLWVAWLTWLVWLGSPMVLRFEASYLSEVTTLALLLASWWSLLSWREERRRRWLIVLALTVGWGAITRPLTMLALAIPIGMVVARDSLRLGLWRDFALACVAGVCVLGVLPIWAGKTTGDWRLSPLEVYRRDYLPFDKYGFAADTSAPRRTVPPALQSVYAYNRHEHIVERPSALPRIAAQRAKYVIVGVFGGARLPLLLFAIVGLIIGGAAVRFAALSALMLFLAHLPYAHWEQWTAYYLEATPAFAFASAVGVWYASRRLLGDHRARWGMLGVMLIVVGITVPAIGRWRRDHLARNALDRSFAAALARLPRHSIVFVRYSSRTQDHIAAVKNQARLDAAPVWVVHDLGARNAELLRLAPDRQSFDFEEDELVRRR